MTNLFIKVLDMSITASYVALMVLLVRMLLKKCPKIFSYMLWSVVLFRLVCPLDFGSPLSLLKPLHNSSNYIPQSIEMMENSTIPTNIETIDRVVHHSLPAATATTSVDPIQIVLSVFTFIWLLGTAVLIGPMSI